MNNKKILISGAGIGGLTLAYFLKKKGFNPIIIEKSDSLRDGGYMIDFFSSGIFVAEQMGIIEELKKKDHCSNIIKQYTEKNKKKLIVNLSNFRESLGGKFFNFLRTDLIDVLYEKIKDKVEIRYSTSIREINQDDNGVHIIFDNGKSEDFDLLIGADGIHSNVRKLTYSKNEIEKYYLDYYVAGLEHSVPLNLKKGEIFSMICPKRQIMTYTSSTNKNTSLFVFQSKQHKRLTTQEKVKILRSEFENFVNPATEIIDQAEKEVNLFFDEVSQIRIKGEWNKGRIALLGDSAYCITLLSGQGASMAMTGGYILAEKLSNTKGDYKKAFMAYESDLRPQVESMQKKAVKNASSYLPTSKFKLWFRNLLTPIVFTKLFSPLIIKQLGAENYFEKNGN